MNPGDSILLACDIIRKSAKALKVYGKMNDKVKVIAVHGDVLIVELKERFSVHIDKVKAL